MWVLRSFYCQSSVPYLFVQPPSAVSGIVLTWAFDVVIAGAAPEDASRHCAANPPCRAVMCYRKLIGARTLEQNVSASAQRVSLSTLGLLG